MWEHWVFGHFSLFFRWWLFEWNRRKLIFITFFLLLLFLGWFSERPNRFAINKIILLKLSIPKRSLLQIEVCFEF